jgi:hypothetical protein
MEVSPQWVRRSPAFALRKGPQARGKSELRRAVRRVTPGRGNSKESGTENIPPDFARFASFVKAGFVKVTGPAAP